jgi:hypothetical protein
VQSQLQVELDSVMYDVLKCFMMANLPPETQKHLASRLKAWPKIQRKHPSLPEKFIGG